MRWLLVWLFAVTACSLTSNGGETANDDRDDASGGDIPFECAIASDCMAASTTCCDCPTFAMPTADGDACSGVVCPVPMDCPSNLEPVCINRHCELACAPIACELSCAYGFATSSTGCLSCECATPPPGGCTQDADCARTRADCCGCEQGGTDTAVLADAVASYDNELNCPPEPQCPTQTNTCDPNLTAQCVQGACELAAVPPPSACGRSDLPVCPDGTVCTVNANDQANHHGVGVCL
ncbi:MAG: hypothetical protein AB7O24_22060 [Kofleriaceae bacterium]